MAHKNIGNTLDNIRHEELGVQFDEGMIWEKLEAKLEGKDKPGSSRWMIAAAVFLAIISLPFLPGDVHGPLDVIDRIPHEVLVLENKSIRRTSKEIFINIGNIASNSVQMEIIDRVSKTWTLGAPMLSTYDIKRRMVPIEINEIQVEFTNEDIAVIQSSLEKSTETVKDGNISIRALWNTPSTSPNVNHQALKIKLVKSQK